MYKFKDIHTERAEAYALKSKLEEEAKSLSFVNLIDACMDYNCPDDYDNDTTPEGEVTRWVYKAELNRRLLIAFNEEIPNTPSYWIMELDKQNS